MTVHSGSGWFDACLVDLSLAIVKLDSDLRRVALFRLNDFAGLLRNVDGVLSAYPIDTADQPTSGVWLGPTQFAVGLGFACAPDNPEGTYVLDLTTQTARRTGDLGQH